MLFFHFADSQWCLVVFVMTRSRCWKKTFVIGSLKTNPKEKYQIGWKSLIQTKFALVTLYSWFDLSPDWNFLFRSRNLRMDVSWDYSETVWGCFPVRVEFRDTVGGSEILRQVFIKPPHVHDMIFCISKLGVGVQNHPEYGYVWWPVLGPKILPGWSTQSRMIELDKRFSSPSG